MKEYLYEYIKKEEELLKKNINNDDIHELVTKIRFFSHERLIHLIVTLFFALISIIFTVISLNYNIVLLYIINIIFYIMLLFYIIHYYYLENGVQYLYKLYDKMNKKIK